MFGEKCGTVQALFLTHTHYDHIYGIKDLLRLYPRLHSLHFLFR
ncbi:MBL fold metallo-hydrolase [Bacteroides uniformis]|nr:MBL fold metallo-hydrolase [Bacteroides uniformis]